MADRGGGGGRGGESAEGRQDGGGGGGGGGKGGSDSFARCQEWGLMEGTLRLRSTERENQGSKRPTMFNLAPGRGSSFALSLAELASPDLKLEFAWKRNLSPPPEAPHAENNPILGF